MRKSIKIPISVKKVKLITELKKEHDKLKDKEISSSNVSSSSNNESAISFGDSNQFINNDQNQNLVDAEIKQTDMQFTQQEE